MRGLATGAAYFIPARMGVWVLWCGSWAPLGDSGLSPPRRAAAAAAHARGSVSGGVRFGKRGPEECVLLGEIYNMCYRS